MAKNRIKSILGNLKSAGVAVPPLFEVEDPKWGTKIYAFSEDGIDVSRATRLTMGGYKLADFKNAYSAATYLVALQAMKDAGPAALDAYLDAAHPGCFEGFRKKFLEVLA